MEHIQTPDNVWAMFNPMTYSKSALVLKMMYHVIGEKPWRDFFVSFVAKHKFGNVDTNDFFDAIKNIGSDDAVLKHHNFKDIFLPWFTQIGSQPTVYIRHDFIKNEIAFFFESIRAKAGMIKFKPDL